MYLYKSKYIIYTVTEKKLDLVALGEYDEVVHYQQYMQMKRGMSIVQ